MIAALQLEPRPLQRGRPPKSTPERIQQIRNLVERGKSRDEIAEIIGVTTGTLQVTCSKLGISLRRPTFDLGTGLLRRKQRYQRYESSHQSRVQRDSSEFQCAKGPRPIPEQPPSRQASAEAPAASGKLNDEDRCRRPVRAAKLCDWGACLLGQAAVQPEGRLP
jgi:hypothetical protein